MSKCPLLVCPECGSPLQHFAINLEENMFVCIGERKRDTFRGVVNQDTYNELKEVRTTDEVLHTLTSA